jgi:hypothetical protein
MRLAEKSHCSDQRHSIRQPIRVRVASTQAVSTCPAAITVAALASASDFFRGFEHRLKLIKRHTQHAVVVTDDVVTHTR